jgi:4-diphosphocytidyl-2-C-methyl-D-erythritol kinase
MSTAVRSHSKINLGLAIGAPRADGFHGLATIYQTLELHDIVEVEARPAAETRLELESNDPRVPADARNTAWKMVQLALAALSVKAAVKITIHKRLPVQGGLGAGSANAVAALVGLEVELGQWKSAEFRFPPIAAKDAAMDGAPDHLDATDWAAQRLEIAAEVGSDVPLFLVGGAVLGTDRGQIVSALPDFEPVWCVVAVPAMGVSTARAFADWDKLCAERHLTQELSADKLKRLSQASVSAFAQCLEAGSSGVLPVGEGLAGQKSALVRTGILSWIENDFEEVVFRQQPSLLYQAKSCVHRQTG